MKKQMILEALDGLRDEFITETGSRLGLWGAGAAAVGATGALTAGGTVEPSHLFTIPSAEAPVKAGFGAWLAHGGWVALVAGALVAVGIGVGAFFLGDRGNSPLGEQVTTAEDTAQGMGMESEEETEPESETEVVTHPCDNGHTLSTWTTSREPTCYRAGESGADCMVCGEWITNPISTTAHDFAEGYCTVCGVVEGADERFVYDFAADKDGVRYAILKARDGAEGERIILPNVAYDAESDGMVEVRELGKGLFLEETSLREVVFPNTLRVIGIDAFNGCSSLAFVDIPDSVTEIGGRAFSGCSSLTEFTIPPTVVSVGGNALFGCHSLEKLTVARLNKQIVFHSLFGIYEVITPGYELVNGENIPSTLKTVEITEGDPIPGGSFQGCKNLTEIIICDDVTEIGSSAFKGCTSLQSINLPSKLTSLSMYLFDYCTSLTEIIIPEGVTTVDRYAFQWCTGLTRLYVPDSVKTFSTEALYECRSLEWFSVPDSDRGKISAMQGAPMGESTVKTLIIRGGTTLQAEEVRGIYMLELYLPATLTRIEDGAMIADRVTDIYFAGTEEQWNAIEIGEGNTTLKRATVHFGVLPE